MKLCQPHRTAVHSMLRQAGQDPEPYREPGQKHTPRSALRQVVQSAAYGMFGKRSQDADFCPACEIDARDEDSAKWLGWCVEEVVSGAAVSPQGGKVPQMDPPRRHEVS